MKKLLAFVIIVAAASDIRIAQTHNVNLLTS